MDPALEELYAEGAPEDEVAVVLRLADSVVVPEGVRIVARFGEIATCRVLRDDLVRLHALQSVLSVKAPRHYGPGDGEAATDADVLPQASDLRRPAGVSDATGRGVLLAHIDWGADFAHADFRHRDGRTRFLAIWDQAAPYDTAHPNRYGYGRIHRRADIDHALQQPDPYAALGYGPARASPRGGSHGSHTLGISGGNGRGGGPSGLAPEAELAFVDLSTQHEIGATGLGDSAALLEGLDFIASLARERGLEQASLPESDIDAAADMPLVVNASLGRQCGQHDGKTLTERGMDAFVLAAPGRAICQSAGNYFDRRIHAEGVLRPGETRTLRIDVGAAPDTPHEIDLWYPGTDRFTCFVHGPGLPQVRAEPGHRTLLTQAGLNIGRVYHRLGDPNNGDNQITLFLDAAAPDGEWRVSLVGNDVVDGRFHAWVERGRGGRAGQARFATGDDVPSTTTGTISNGLRTISVGAYDPHREDHPLAHFSSGGPTRDGRTKPDCVAPGVRILSTRSDASDAQADAPVLLRMSGTSMAAPHVAGTVALMFSVAGRPLRIDETRRLLLSNTRAAEAVDDVERARIGCGYLDSAAAVGAARALALPPGAESLFPPDGALPAPAPPIDRLRRSDAMSKTRPAEPSAPTTPSAPPDPLAGLLPSEAEALEEDAEASSQDRFKGRDNGGRALPFQVQLPLGGGSPALALPLGGPSSPFAFTVPLGATPSAAAPAAAAPDMPAALVAPPRLEPPLVVAGDEPLFVAAEGEVLEDRRGNGGSCGRCSAQSRELPAAAPAPSIDPASWPLIWPSTGPAAPADPPAAPPHKPLAVRFGANLLSAAEDAGDEPCRSASSWLQRLLEQAQPGTRDSKVTLSPFGADGPLPSATSLFNAFVYPGGHPLRNRTLTAHYARRFRVLARPGDTAADLELREGDLLIRVALGQGFSHLAIVASPSACERDALPARQWQGEGHPRPANGLYLHVVERLPRPRRAADRFARRFADAQWRVLPDTLLLRPVAPPSHLENDSVEAFDEARGDGFDEQAAVGPDSAIADRFIAAHASRFCTPGQSGSATCRGLATPRPITRVVIHVLAVPSTTRRSGVEAVVAGWQNAGRVASSHYIVDRDGLITQMVREADVAFHTPGNNSDSIGIEHADVCNDPAPLTERLYERSAALVRDLASRHHFALDATHVAGHSQVNPNHGDPGPYWDWEYYRLLLAWPGSAAGSRPRRFVTSMAAQATPPAGWQAQQRRAIPNDHCANQNDPWSATYWRASRCTAGMAAAEASLVIDEAGTYEVSLWWPRVEGANPAAQIDVEVACLSSPCVGASMQNVAVDQRTGSGRWNDVAVIQVTRAPSELKLRWHCPPAHDGFVVADAVRALKIASNPPPPARLFTPSGGAEAAPSPPPRSSACAYFFKDGDYVRYNVLADTVDAGPASVSRFWRLPADFQSNIDAIVNWGNGHAYFFKGPKYLRYNITTDRVDMNPTDIYPAWPALPEKFRRDLDAVVNWGNGKAYFFKGSDYVRYDIATDRVDVGTTPISREWTSLPAAFQSGLQAGVNWTAPCDLTAFFRSAGLTVNEVPGWPTAGSGGFAPEGIMIHHSGGNGLNDLNVVINGRPATPTQRALPGPLANFYVARNAEIHMVAGRSANHAGPGAQRVLDEVRRSVAPSGTAAQRGLGDGPSGGTHFYGFECENFGNGQDWPDAQLDTMARAAAALCQRHCWNENRVIGHAEWTRRKIDPQGFTMDDFRARVARLF